MIDKIIDGFSKIGEWLSKFFSGLFDILVFPFKLIVSLIDGIFYFITVLFDIVVIVIKIFVSLFQYIFALISGLFRSISSWLTFSVKGNISFPSSSGEGFNTVIDILGGTGILTVVPIVATAFVWFYFILKIVGLIGGHINVRPFGRSD